jgi:hypothetical protein
MTEVSKNLDAIFANKRKSVMALCLAFAGQILAEFRVRQPLGQGVVGQYWTNRLNIAAPAVFSDAFIDGDDLGFFIAHMEDYGVYLELANDRKHEALRPLIEEFYPKFKAALEYIYAD